MIQHGVIRCAIFVDNVGRRRYYDLLCDAASTHDIAVHVSVFIGNHIHLLLTSPQLDALSRAVRNTGQCQVQAFNRRHRRSGALARSVQILLGRRGALHDDGLSVHRAESGQGSDG
jgi:putative transposase